jgi:hypothetical protein
MLKNQETFRLDFARKQSKKNRNDRAAIFLCLKDITD